MKAVLSKVVQETHDTKTFVFDLDEPMVYKTAQFVMLKLNSEVPPRPFSIANAPNNDRIEVTARIYPDGKFTPHLSKLKVGDEIEVTGPHGKFIYEKGRATLIGAGTGIAPLRGIMQCSIKDGQQTEMHYTDKSESDLIYKDELEDLRNQRKLHLNLVVTREPESHLAGRIDHNYLKRKISKDGNFYICGPPDFVNETINNLKKLGISEEQIKKEKF